MLSGLLSPSEPISCPTGQYFESSHAVPRCDLITEAEPGFCDNSCSPCEVFYSHSGDLTPDPYDCSNFYVCLDGGVLIETSCSTNQYYDYRSGFCQDDPAMCYDFCDNCTAYCTTVGNVADPMDCTSFYQCNPPDLIHYLCPANYVFDSVTKVCSATAICDDSCYAQAARDNEKQGEVDGPFHF